jgi:hypothetical protein
VRFHPAITLLASALTCCLSLGQNAPENQAPKDQPQVRVNYLNVCTPSEDEQKEIRTSLARLPAPKFAPDFEISRGHSTLDQAPSADWVRIRREFGPAVPFTAAQYSFSVDQKAMIESLVFRSREAKDVLQVQLEDTVTGALDAKSVLGSDTPVSRIKLERFGKASVVLTRCPTADQTAYEPLFRSASDVLARYRTALTIKTLIPRELAALHTVAPTGATHPTQKKKK